jgi:hypothetical protein
MLRRMGKPNLFLILLKFPERKNCVSTAIRCTSIVMEVSKRHPLTQGEKT